MLLRIKQPTCAADMLRATHLAGEVLNYIANWQGNSLDDTDFKSTISCGKWLLRKPKNVIDAIKGLLVLSRQEREEVRDAFWHDIQYCNRIDDDNFDFQLRPELGRAHQKCEEFLTSFYKDILSSRSGFQNLSGQELTPLNGVAVESGYRKANAARDQVCPACLGELKRRRKGRSQVDREHFFPKSRYPALAVHPCNIVLTCIECNERAHLDDDPIDADRTSALKRTFIPYLRDGLSELSVSFSPAKPVVCLSGDTQSGAEIRVANFDRIYGIAEYWSDKMDYMQDILYSSIVSHCEPLEEAHLKKWLNDEVGRCDLTQYSTPDSYLLGQFVRYLITKPFDFIRDEIKEWRFKKT